MSGSELYSPKLFWLQQPLLFSSLCLYAGLS